MHIGILQTGHVNPALVDANGDYDTIFPNWLAGRGLTFSNYPVVDGVFPNSPADAEGWLITGSKFGAYEDHAWIPPLEALIRDIVAADLPLVGVCFGHQIIAQALGGRVEKFTGGWSVGRQEYEMDGRVYGLNAWHQDQVVAVPDGAQVLCSTPFCANAALLYPGKAFTIQPHPEIGRDYLTGMIEVLAPGVVPDDLARAARAKLDQPTDSAPLAEMTTRFFRERTLA